MAFVIFRIPQTTEITLWEGEITEKKSNFCFNNYNQFIISEFNEGNSILQLIPSVIKLNEEINFDSLKFHFNDDLPINLNQKEYCDLIKKGIDKIKSNPHFKKVVLARTETSCKTLNIERSYNNLCENYPNAFVYLLSSEATGTWLGASPEVFLDINQNKIKTVALAGTISSEIKETNWSNKEIIEHKRVEEFIEDVFDRLDQKYEKDGPKTLEIGNLKHILSEYSIEINDEIRVSQIIQELNPTSATGGIPKNESCEFIKTKEQFDRKYYTGILGPVYRNKSAKLFVNLRCVQIHSGKITQYAGAGITNESIPKNEWMETLNKMKMIKSKLEFID